MDWTSLVGNLDRDNPDQGKKSLSPTTGRPSVPPGEEETTTPTSAELGVWDSRYIPGSFASRSRTSPDSASSLIGTHLFRVLFW